MWNKLTIQQAQEIDKLRRNVYKEDTEIDVETKLLSIILNKQQSEIDSLGWQEYLDQRAALKFLEQEPEGTPIQYVTIGKRKYRFVYDIRQMPFARYIESKTFAQDFVGNLHKLAASMVIPQRKTWYGKWKDVKYDASKHIEYATDMLQAPFEAVYGSAVFFYHLYKNWIIASKDYMINEQVKMGKTQEEAEKLVNDLCSSLDGITRLRKLRHTLESV
jgi:hypothetical protein